MVKHLLSISFAVIILLSGMNLTIATHYCRGEIAATKISFSGKPASCGMESGTENSSSSETGITTHCCEDKIAAYTIDSNYCPSEIHLKNLTRYILATFGMPVNVSFIYYHNPSSFLADKGPPYLITENAVSRAEICVFRI